MKTIIKTLAFILVSGTFALSSCTHNKTNSYDDSAATEYSATVENSEDMVHHDDLHWKLLNFSDGTYGAEVNGHTVLTGCENKIYCEGYDGNYVFKTQIGNDHYVYDINGNLLFCLQNTKHINIMSYMTNNTLTNGYILATDLDDNEGVFNLDGDKIIETKFNSINMILSDLGNDECAIWGFKCRKDNDDEDYVYDWDGNFIFSGESLYKETSGVYPIFGGEINDESVLFNHKGEQIIKTDDYFDYDIEVTNEGMSYIVVQTEEDIDEYRESSDCEWIDIDGYTLKPVEGSRDYSLWDENIQMARNFKNKMRDRMRSIRKFKPVNDNSSSYNEPTSNNASSDYNQNWNNNNNLQIENQSNTTTDNSNYESFYNNTYQKYESRVIDLFNTLSTLQSTSNGGGTSSYAISNTKSSIRDMQSEMQRVRNEAQQHNVYISVSSWENASY